MSDFDDVMKDLRSDIKTMADEVGKKTNETVEVSKLRMERMKLKNRVKSNYQRLGEVIYGGRKNQEDVSDVTSVLYSQLDTDFARIEQIYDEIRVTKAKYAEAYTENAEGGTEPDFGDKVEDAAEKAAETVSDAAETIADEVSSKKDDFNVDAD